MRRQLHIRRQASAEGPVYWEDYIFETDDEAATVATALRSLSDKMRLSSDMPYRPIIWEHSCLQKKCGACAMVIDGVPALACDTRLMECKEKCVTIEPLKKFPLVSDLMVDRAALMDRLIECEVWFERPAASRGEETTFEAAQCLQCGLCLEVCPNFAVGERFGGMAAMTAIARLLAKTDGMEQKRAKAMYRKAVYAGCGKSLACHNICPAHIDIERLLVKSNRKAWQRKE